MGCDTECSLVAPTSGFSLKCYNRLTSCSFVLSQGCANDVRLMIGPSLSSKIIIKLPIISHSCVPPNSLFLFTPGCEEYSYIRIFFDTNIRSYHIRIIFLIRIYSDIRSYCFFDTNIFGYSFVSFF